MTPLHVLRFAAVLILLAPAAHGAPIPGLFDTGVDATGQALASGVVDPHYQLVASADPTHPGPTLYTAEPIAQGYWLANVPTSRWIAPAIDEGYPSGSTNLAAGDYDYRLTFDLTGFDPATVSISGGVAGDNTVIVRLNGITIMPNAAGYNPLSPFSANQGFVAGVNRLDFIVTNFPAGGANPSGLRVGGLAGTGTPVAAVGDAADRGLELAAPSPNPSFGGARLDFVVPAAAHVRLRVFDLAGRPMRTLADQPFAAGAHAAQWDGADEAGHAVGAGIYFVRLESGGTSLTRRLARM